MSDDNFSAEELAELGFETEAELEAWVGPADDEQGQAILDGIASLITDSAIRGGLQYADGTLTPEDE